MYSFVCDTPEAFILGIFQTSGTLEPDHLIARDLTFWKRYELSVDLNIEANAHNGWSNILHFFDSNVHLSTWNQPGSQIPGIYQHKLSNRLALCNFVNNNGNICTNHDVSENEWFNVKFLQVILIEISFVSNCMFTYVEFKAEESGQFHYSIFLDGDEIISLINTSPKVFSGVHAQTGRTIIPENASGNYVAANGSFRNLKLTSEYNSLNKKVLFQVCLLANVYRVSTMEFVFLIMSPIVEHVLACQALLATVVKVSHTL